MFSGSLLPKIKALTLTATGAAAAGGFLVGAEELQDDATEHHHCYSVTGSGLTSTAAKLPFPKLDHLVCRQRNISF